MKDYIELPDMADGNCTCVNVETITRGVPKGRLLTIGTYCMCKLEPKRGKKRKFEIQMIGLQEKK